VAERAALAALLFAVVFISPAMAQQKTKVAATPSCESGFAERGYPHGSELNFRCRTRVIDCPEKRGHDARIVLEPSFETARGLQFGYRCEYMGKGR
jgi:hypothetical protein